MLNFLGPILIFIQILIAEKLQECLQPESSFRIEQIITSSQGSCIILKLTKIKEKHYIQAILQQNGYPKDFIQRTINKHNRRKDSKWSTQKQEKR